MLKNIKLLFLINFFTDFRLYAPIAIIYFSDIAGSMALGMGVFSVISISNAIFELPMGILSDYIGRKKTIILGAIAATAAVFFYAIANVYWILLIGACFEGLSRSLYSGNNDALLHDTLKEHNLSDDYHHHHGKLSSMFQLALGASALIGGFMAFYSFKLVFYLSVFPQLICFLLSLFLIEPRINRERSHPFTHLIQSINLFIKNPQLRLLSVSSIIGYGFGESGWLFRSAFIATIWPVWAIGIPQTLSNIGAAIGFYFAGKVIQKFSVPKILFFGEIYDKVINISSLIYITVLSPIFMSATSFIFGLSSTASATMFQKNFSDSQRATMGSLNSLLSQLFFGVVAFSIGLIGDIFSPASALLSIQFVTLINIFFLFKLLKIKPSKF